ncbi:MAG: Calx-beta domain-containing protein, partial [Crocosphaera sp.]
MDLFEFDDGTFAFDELFGETPPPTPDPSVVSIASIEQEEGDDGTTEFVFTVTRSGDDSEAVTVDWDIELIAGQANASDFVFGQPANGDVTIEAGQTSAEVVIEVQGDTDVETDEDFIVTLSNPSVGTIGEDTATGT